ncbi:MAG: malto-oligosyltrehalose trehalohydrolase [bacterium]
MKIGAWYQCDGRCGFSVWAPFLKHVSCEIVAPEKLSIPLQKYELGYWKGSVSGISPGSRYYFKLEENLLRPDPASHFQPEGVHGPSMVIDHEKFQWGDSSWQGIPLEKMIIYEIHTGTFTHEGTFEACIGRLDNLLDLGVNTIEIMPVAQFPGERNWGYDGVHPFAVQNSYGGPRGLKGLVNACHIRGISVILDVVYNHLGPEGNYLADFGPYFTDKYKTPWGKAVNFDGAYSDSVRDFMIQNALYWFEYYHIDALRLDAVHGIYDTGAKHILEELAEKAGEFSNTHKREFYLIAESDLNDVRVIRNRESGGYGIDAQWCDDFHHSVHTILTQEKSGYYMDFGKVENLVKSLQEGFVYSWEYSPYRKRHHGSPSRDLPADRFVTFIQNHDQVGNRMLGERLAQRVSFEALKLAAGVLMVSPYIPLLFMGEEYAEDAPFLYFISHLDDNLIRAVREGRKREFSAFQWKGEPPDPQSHETFLKTKLQWDKQKGGKHKVIRGFYQQVIRFRKEIPALSNLNKDNLKAWHLPDKSVIFLTRRHRVSKILSIMNFSDQQQSLLVDFIEGKGVKRLDSSETKWMGPGGFMPESIEKGQQVTIGPSGFILYEMET